MAPVTWTYEKNLMSQTEERLKNEILAQSE